MSTGLAISLELKTIGSTESHSSVDENDIIQEFNYKVY
jgi:hypothetical protein